MKKFWFFWLIVLILFSISGCEYPEIGQEVSGERLFSFAIVGDPHIGAQWKDGKTDFHCRASLEEICDKDFNGQGWCDKFYRKGEDYPKDDFTNLARESVELINSLKRDKYKDLAFVVVIGDLTSSAEISELTTAKVIFDEFEIPWIPIIGNHDLWPYAGTEEAEAKEMPDKYFHQVFADKYRQLSEQFLNWVKAPNPIWNNQIKVKRDCYFQNFAFDYKGYHFICLDFNPRYAALGDSRIAPGAPANADLFDGVEGAAWDFFQKLIWKYSPEEKENIIIFSHQPMIADLTWGFAYDDKLRIENFLKKYGFTDNIWGNFAGHTHRDKVTYDQGCGMWIVETPPAWKMKKPVVRIVEVYSNGVIKHHLETAVLPSPAPTPAPPPTPKISGKIAFVSDRDGNSEIYLMNIDGENQTNLTNHPATDLDPAWSPDGSKIAFSSNRDGDFEIYIMNVNDGKVIQLTNNSAYDGEPDWSPDGRNIIFCSNRDGNYEIYIMEANGNNQRNLTNHSKDDGWPRYSPDGQKIAFCSKRAYWPLSMFWILHIMKVDGTEVTCLQNLIYSGDSILSDWSPDGKYLAFSTRGVGWSEVHLFRVGTHKDDEQLLTPFGEIDFGGSFSPDSTQLAFASYKDGNWEIYRIDIETKNVKRLTNHPAADWDPAWSPK